MDDAYEAANVPVPRIPAAGILEEAEVA
jgi:hypothetical protein